MREGSRLEVFFGSFRSVWLTCLLRSSIIRVIWIFFLPIVPVFSSLSFTNELYFFFCPSVFSLAFSSNQAFFSRLPLLSSKIPVAVPAKGREREALSQMKNGKTVKKKTKKKKRGKAESEPHGTANKDKRNRWRSEAALFSAINIMQIRFSASAATMRVDSTVMLSLQSQRIWQCFGSATNLTALIICSVTFTVAWMTSGSTFLNNDCVTLSLVHWMNTVNLSWKRSHYSPCFARSEVEPEWKPGPSWFRLLQTHSRIWSLCHVTALLLSPFLREWGVSGAYIGTSCWALSATERLPSPEKLTQAFSKMLLALRCTLAITEHTRVRAPVFVCMCAPLWCRKVGQPNSSLGGAAEVLLCFILTVEVITSLVMQMSVPLFKLAVMQ